MTGTRFRLRLAMEVMARRVESHLRRHARAGSGPPWFAAATKMPTEQAWRRCMIAFLAVFFGGLGSIYAFVLAVDPYDTGRFPTPLRSRVSARQGLFETGQRTGSASRGRDLRFNAALFGDSRTQLLDPAKLSEATGLSFVQLT